MRGQIGSPVYYAVAGEFVWGSAVAPYDSGRGCRLQGRDERHRTANCNSANIHLSIPCRDEIIALMQKKELSLRERRREQTWRALHEAALKRVREHGMRGPTVEEIAREAGVSPRTFFNYFPSKEDAVLGLREPVVSEEILETDRLHEDENTIIRVTHLLWQIIFHSFYYIKVKSNDFQTHCREFPDSAKRFKMHHMRCEQVLTEYLNTIDWVAFDAAGRRGPFPRRSPSDPLTDHLQERARAKVQLASAVLRQLEFARHLEDEEEINRGIRQTVKTYQFLLFEQGRPAI